MQTLKDILEIIYYLSGPIIAILAFKALGQIKVAKKQVAEYKEDRILSSKRDSYKIAVDKCDYFMTTIIPLINNLDESVEKNNITFFEKSTITIGINDIKVKPNYKDIEELKIEFNNLPILNLLNPLESFSLFFTSGVAEENIGYLTVGKTYCGVVKRYLPLIEISSHYKYFGNIIQLFRIWNNRIESEKPEQGMKRIEKELSNNKEITIKCIGTE